MNKFFKNSSLPKLEDYEKLSKHNTINENSQINENISKIEESDKNSIYDFNFVKTKDENNSNGIMDVYKSTFYNKMKGWTRDEKIKNYKKKMDRISRENNQKFIRELRNIKRKPNLFSDAYSLRDGIINEKIKLLNKSLNIPIYSKKVRFKIVDDFNNYFEKKEKERLLNEEIMKKKQLEEEELIKSQDEHYQLMEKMKKNLNSENVENADEEKISFKYRYSSVINQRKNENLLKKISKDAFNDYLLSLNYIKLKSAKSKDENIDNKE